MSWILILVSTYVPIVILSILVFMNSLHSETQSMWLMKASRGC
jgi:hypothetical protein